MKKPLIGILTNVLTVEEGIFAGSERLYIPRDYVNSIVRAGGIPLLLPIVADTVCGQIEVVDALILAGGQDVHPRHYGQESSAALGAVCQERDLYEMEAIKYAVTRKKPILGVCRGLQVLNVAFGGSLYQDIPSHFPENAVKHSQKVKKEEGTHRVEIAEGSQLWKMVGKQMLMTNSFHHQAIKELAPGFAINARSEDGLIEGIEYMEAPLIVGVQWHPEMMASQNDDMQQLFTAFVQMVRAQ